MPTIDGVVGNLGEPLELMEHRLEDGSDIDVENVSRSTDAEVEDSLGSGRSGD